MPVAASTGDSEEKALIVKEEGVMGGTHTFTFDYRITGIREGHEGKQIVRSQ